MEIKENIQWLCKILELNGFSPITPETFRKAKFNQDNDIFQLWKLLYELVCWLHEQKVQCCNDLENGKIYELKKKMKLFGYNSSSFLKLDLTSKFCSRELLLAVGWLMAKYNLINMLASNFITFSIINCEDTSCISKEQKLKKFCCSEKNLQCFNQIIWSLRHLKYTLNSLSTVQQRRIKYLHEIHLKTQGKGLTHDSIHLSMLEGIIINTTDLQKQFLEQLEKERKFFIAYIQWKEGEKIFWKWMESIIILKNKECSKNQSVRKNSVFSNNFDENKHLQDENLHLQNIFKNFNFYHFLMQEPRLIFENSHSEKRKNTLKKINKGLEFCKDSYDKQINLKNKKYLIIFEELINKFYDVMYIPP